MPAHCGSILEFVQTKRFVCSILPTEMTSLDRSDDNDLLLALRHPLRRRILRHMADAEAISPRQLSAALDQPLGKVSYHVRVLAECSAVALARTEPARGSLRHFYTPTVKKPWARKVLGLDGEGKGETPDDPGS